MSRIRAGACRLDDDNRGRFWNAVDCSAAISYVIPVGEEDDIAIQLDWVGNTTGATKVEFSLSHRVNNDGTVRTMTPATSWTDITANAVAKVPFCTKQGTDPAGATGGPVLFVIQRCPVGVLRVTYTPSAGGGTRTMTGIYSAKGV